MSTSTIMLQCFSKKLLRAGKTGRDRPAQPLDRPARRLARRGHDSREAIPIRTARLFVWGGADRDSRDTDTHAARADRWIRCWGAEAVTSTYFVTRVGPADQFFFPAHIV
jgi:hypothetical protein